MWACYTLFIECSLVLLDPTCSFILSLLDISSHITLFSNFSLDLQKLPLIEEQLGKLVTDDPSVVETTLGEYGDLVYPDNSSVLKRFVLSHRVYSLPTFIAFTIFLIFRLLQKRGLISGLISSGLKF